MDGDINYRLRFDCSNKIIVIMEDLKIRDKIKVGELETEVAGFKQIGENKMVSTEYGDFNINIIQKV